MRPTTRRRPAAPSIADRLQAHPGHPRTWPAASSTSSSSQPRPTTATATASPPCWKSSTPPASAAACRCATRPTSSRCWCGASRKTCARSARSCPSARWCPVVLEGLAADTPELELADLLKRLPHQLREQRLKGASSKQRAAELLVVTNLQKRLLSSIEAFHRTLGVHCDTLRAARVPASACARPGDLGAAGAAAAGHRRRRRARRGR